MLHENWNRRHFDPILQLRCDQSVDSQAGGKIAAEPLVKVFQSNACFGEMRESSGRWDSENEDIV